MMHDQPPGGSMPGDHDRDHGAARPWFPPASEPGSQGTPGAGPGYGQPAGTGYGRSSGTGYGPPGGYGFPPPGGGFQPMPPWPGTPQAPKPGIIPLRPLGVGELLDGAFTSIRRNPRWTLGMAAALLTVAGVIIALTSLILVHVLGQVKLPPAGQQLTHQQVVHLLRQVLEIVVPTVAVSAGLAFLVDIILAGLLAVVIGPSVLGRKITAKAAWRAARPRLWALLGASVLTVFIVAASWLILLLLVVILVVAGAPAAGIAGLAVLGGIASLCLSIWFVIMLRMAGPVVVLERLGPVRALERSWRLVTRSFWRVLGINLLAGLIVAVTSGVLQLPFSLLAALTGGNGNPLFAGAGTGIAALVISTIGTILAGSVARPISAGVAVLLYVDLRIRREGLDLVLQNAALGQGLAAGDEVTGDEFASVWRPGLGMPRESAPPGTPPPPTAGTPPAW